MQRIFSLLIFVFLLISCNREKEGPVFIQGKQPGINNQQVFLVEARMAQDYTNFFRAVDSSYADKEGRYTLSTNIKGGDFYQLRDHHGQMLWLNDLYLRPGDSLRISETEIFSNSKETTAIIQFPAKLSEAFPREAHKWITSKPKGFHNTIDNRFREMKDFLSSFFEDMDIPKNVKERYEKEIQLKKINEKLDYLEHHNSYAYGEWYPLPLDSMDFEQPVKTVLQDTTWHFLSDYKDLVQKYVTATYNTHFFNPLDGKTDKRAMMTKRAIIDTMFNGIQRDIALSTMARDFWRYLPAMQEQFYKDGAKILDYFDHVKTSSLYFEYYKNVFSDFQTIKHGKRAPGFLLPDTSGSKVSLKDFSGKHVYITFWNTMNRPFISNLDAYRRLSKKFRVSDELAMVFIALQPDNDDAERAWRYFIKTYPFGENHLLARGQENNPEIKPYLIQAMPVHVLIDPEGNILTPRAPGPEEISKTISRLTGQQLQISALQ
ncbi:MAG: redoxin domain-containing protein [Bacteroidales bacterium]